jgi:hypothetical protein
LVPYIQLAQGTRIIEKTLSEANKVEEIKNES